MELFLGICCFAKISPLLQFLQQRLKIIHSAAVAKIDVDFSLSGQIVV